MESTVGPWQKLRYEYWKIMAAVLHIKGVWKGCISHKSCEVSQKSAEYGTYGICVYLHLHLKVNGKHVFNWVTGKLMLRWVLLDIL